MFRSAFAAAALAAFILPATAQEAATIGPVIGEPAPALSATSSTGESLDLAAISGTEGAVLVFSRSLDWCPFCKKQAIEFETIAADLAAQGWPVSLLTYDSVDILSGFAAAEGISYTLLSDPDSVVINAFNLRNPEVRAGSRFDGIPHPVVLFISADGTVKAMLREESYRDRPANSLVLETAAALSAAD